MATFKSDADIHREIGQLIESDSLRAVAKRLGVSPAYLSDIRNRRRGLSDNFAAKLGYERVIRWKRIGD